MGRYLDIARDVMKRRAPDVTRLEGADSSRRCEISEKKDADAPDLSLLEGIPKAAKAGHKTTTLTQLPFASADAPGPCRISAVTPDSRNPLVAPEIRCKIERIETEARAKGWPAELLWNADFWDRPRGLAALLDADDEIAEVTPDYISIFKTRHYMLRFPRANG
jgi:hypothetical protein